MADKGTILEDLEWEMLNMKGSLSQLLFSDEIILAGTHFTDLNIPPSNSPTMLCFEKQKDETNQRPKARDRKQQKEDSIICPTTNPGGKSSKRMKLESSESTSSLHAKTKRKGMGERIAALKQLVSPYGKTDTSSVLHEAHGYIRFLHEQVGVLCSPYFEVFPSTPGGGGGSARKKNKLRSRGLCLVPSACCRTFHENSDGNQQQ